MTTVPSDTEACRQIVDLIYEHCGITLHDGKEALIKARLGKLMRRRGISTLGEYLEFLDTAADAGEFTRMVDALTTNFTNFLREPDHFEFLVHQALPSTLEPSRRSFQIWSAASSSGEEPYTVAMFLEQHYPTAQGWDWQVMGSDISTRMLALAQRGVYPIERLENVPREWLHKYFQRGVGAWEGQVRIQPALARRVHFRQINLIQPYSHPTGFPVIFCRNVMIYFDRHTQEQLVNQLCRFLQPGGYLMIGHSESLNGLKVPVRCIRPSIYQLA